MGEFSLTNYLLEKFNSKTIADLFEHSDINKYMFKGKILIAIYSLINDIDETYKEIVKKIAPKNTSKTDLEVVCKGYDDSLTNTLLTEWGNKKKLTKAVIDLINENQKLYEQCKSYISLFIKGKNISKVILPKRGEYKAPKDYNPNIVDDESLSDKNQLFDTPLKDLMKTLSLNITENDIQDGDFLILRDVPIKAKRFEEYDEDDEDEDFKIGDKTYIYYANSDKWDKSIQGQPILVFSLEGYSDFITYYLNAFDPKLLTLYPDCLVNNDTVRQIWQMNTETNDAIQEWFFIDDCIKFIDECYAHKPNDFFKQYKISDYKIYCKNNSNVNKVFSKDNILHYINSYLCEYINVTKLNGDYYNSKDNPLKYMFNKDYAKNLSILKNKDLNIGYSFYVPTSDNLFGYRSPIKNDGTQSFAYLVAKILNIKDPSEIKAAINAGDEFKFIAWDADADSFQTLKRLSSQEGVVNPYINGRYKKPLRGERKDRSSLYYEPINAGITKDFDYNQNVDVVPNYNANSPFSDVFGSQEDLKKEIQNKAKRQSNQKFNDQLENNDKSRWLIRTATTKNAWNTLYKQQQRIKRLQQIIMNFIEDNKKPNVQLTDTANRYSKNMQSVCDKLDELKDALNNFNGNSTALFFDSNKHDFNQNLENSAFFVKFAELHDHVNQYIKDVNTLWNSKRAETSLGTAYHTLIKSRSVIFSNINDLLNKIKKMQQENDSNTNQQTHNSNKKLDEKIDALMNSLGKIREIRKADKNSGEYSSESDFTMAVGTVVTQKKRYYPKTTDEFYANLFDLIKEACEFDKTTIDVGQIDLSDCDVEIIQKQPDNWYTKFKKYINFNHMFEHLFGNSTFGGRIVMSAYLDDAYRFWKHNGYNYSEPLQDERVNWGYTSNRPDKWFTEQLFAALIKTTVNDGVNEALSIIDILRKLPNIKSIIGFEKWANYKHLKMRSEFDNMFTHCNALENIGGIDKLISEAGKHKLQSQSAVSINYIFEGCSSLKTFNSIFNNTKSFIVNNQIIMGECFESFSGCSSFNGNIEFNNCVFTSSSDLMMQEMFKGCSNLQRVTFMNCIIRNISMSNKIEIKDAGKIKIKQRIFKDMFKDCPSNLILDVRGTENLGQMILNQPFSYFKPMTMKLIK